MNRPLITICQIFAASIDCQENGLERQAKATMLPADSRTLCLHILNNNDNVQATTDFENSLMNICGFW